MRRRTRARLPQPPTPPPQCPNALPHNAHPPRWLGGWTGAFALNAVITLVFLAAGLGAGGYSSIVALVEAVGTFGLFAKCYNC